MFDLFTILIAAIIVVVYITYKIKHDFLRWLFILLPPLSLIFLIFVPWDILTIIFWGPAYIAVIYSFFSILYKLITYKKPHAIPLKIRLIRPVLVICTVVGAGFVVSFSLKSAEIYAVETAKQIHQSSQDCSTYPDMIEGWNKNDAEWSNCYTRFGKYGTKYPMHYSVNEDGREFTISVRHNIDAGFFVTGRFGQALKAEFFVCSSAYDVDIETLERTEKK